MVIPLKITRHLARLLPRREIRYRSRLVPQGRPKVLVVGVYVGNKPSLIEHLVAQIGNTAVAQVTQRWVAIKGQPPSPAVAAVTIDAIRDYVPKWRLLEDLVLGAPDQDYDYVVFCDDDIWVGDGFIDQLIAHQQALDFAIAQPSRTWRSFTDWTIVRRRPDLIARQTGYVESGPVVSMTRTFFQLVTPFSMESPMGWGYDLVWPKIAEANGLTLGIIDAVPVDHSFRGRGDLYNSDAEIVRMSAYLANHDHVRELRTFRNIRSLPR